MSCYCASRVPCSLFRMASAKRSSCGTDSPPSARPQLWGYVAGEFGGGRWEIERAAGVADSIDYTDLRVMVGVESVHVLGLKGHVEVGYVFSRRVNFLSDTPDYKPQNALMLRAGFRY